MQLAPTVIRKEHKLALSPTLHQGKFQFPILQEAEQPNISPHHTYLSIEAFLFYSQLPAGEKAQ